MEQALKDLIEISRSVGADPALVQGGGGNTSVKDGRGGMYVKASGTALKDMNAEGGYRLVDLERCAAMLADDALEELSAAELESEIASRLEAACIDDDGTGAGSRGRPSVETNLHALLGRCVAHTHPASVNAILCCEGGEQLLSEIYGDAGAPYMFLPYVNFGYPLARRMSEAVREYVKENGAPPAVVFLENHGLFVSGESAGEVLELTGDMVKRAADYLEAAARSSRKRCVPEVEADVREGLVLAAVAELRRLYSEAFQAPALLAYDPWEGLQDFFLCPEPDRLAHMPPIVPDQQVYCNGSPVWVDFSSDPDKLRDAVRCAVEGAGDGAVKPVCVLVDGLGLITAGTGRKLLDSARASMKAALSILAGAQRCGEPHPLSPEALGYIKESEWEKYRHRQAEAGGGASALRGRVAVVSGAGSGLGRGISIGLAAEGMHVVLADIDEEGVKETAGLIRAEDGPAEVVALPLRADVTVESDVESLYAGAVKRLGGVDLLVNCASIAPPLPLIEFSAEQFRRALDINLTGYMLMARGAARVMERQGTGGSIINLSSKSGLEPSKNNSAYNATKAGEVHMARGWALELAPHGIRVNSVCPGNVFQGSRIWSEEYIAAVAKKRGIRPEEVKPYYIGMTALKREILWEDVANAVIFLAGEGASKITGQTLVVDGGQVFVR